MFRLNGLIPARFLLLISHLILNVTIFWIRDENVKACLPWSYTQEEYSQKDKELIIGLSLSIALLLFEFVGFLGGVSMFSSSQSLISIGAHSAGSISLAFFVTDLWSCNSFWWIFGFCSGLPAIIEVVLWIGVFGLKKRI